MGKYPLLEYILKKRLQAGKIFLNSKDEFLQIAVGEGDSIEISNESGFDLFKEGIV